MSLTSGSKVNVFCISDDKRPNEVFADISDAEMGGKSAYVQYSDVKGLLSKGGGSAFGEFHQVGEAAQKVGGMTLRDYFAAKAMQGYVGVCHYKMEVLSAMAYAQADAMLAERAK